MANLNLINNILSNEIDPAFQARAKYIISEIIKYKPKIILDAGCGRGFYIKLLSLLDFPVTIIGIELSKDYIKIASQNNQKDKRVKLIQGSVYNLPFDNNYFDCIICSEVLEHLDNDQKALKEFKRVLKSNGKIIITVPNNNFPLLWDPLNWIMMKMFHKHINKNMWWLAGIWADHERLYSYKMIDKLAGKIKMKIINQEYIIRRCWPFSHFILYGIGKNIVERVGIKSVNRFDYRSKPLIIKFLSKFFGLPGRILNKNSATSVNIAVTIRK